MTSIVMHTKANYTSRSQQNDVSPGITPLRMHIHTRLGEKQLSTPPTAIIKLPTVAGRRQPNTFTG